MAQNYVHFDFYDDKNFKVNSEHGYVKDFDLTINTDNKQISVRLHKEQAYVLLQELKDQFE